MIMVVSNQGIQGSVQSGSNPKRAPKMDWNVRSWDTLVWGEVPSVWSSGLCGKEGKGFKGWRERLT